MIAIIFKVLLLVTAYKQVLAGDKMTAKTWGFVVAGGLTLMAFPWAAVLWGGVEGFGPWVRFGVAAVLYFLCAPVVFYLYWRHDEILSSTVIASLGTVLFIVVLPFAAAVLAGLFVHAA